MAALLCSLFGTMRLPMLQNETMMRQLLSSMQAVLRLRQVEIISSKKLMLIMDEHRFCLAQHRRCSTEIRYLKLLIVRRSPAKYLSFEMPLSLLSNGFGYSWRSYLSQLSQSELVLEFGILEEKALLGLGTTSRNVHILFTYSSSQPVAGPSTPDSPTPRTPTNASTAQYILNDTSLAAVILPNNDRHLYFQDSTGRIRYVIRTASNSQWNSGLDSNITASAKNHTPLAVTAFEPNGPVKVWAAVLSTFGALLN